jgi:hypothetical protein
VTALPAVEGRAGRGVGGGCGGSPMPAQRVASRGSSNSSEVNNPHVCALQGNSFTSHSSSAQTSILYSMLEKTVIF